MNTIINIYNGNQIGGCITCIKTPKTKICIDFGENLPGNNENEKKGIDGLTNNKAKPYDALFFTHYHGDHVGRMQDVIENVKMYLGKTAKEVLLEINKTIKNEKMCDILNNEERVITFVENQTIKVGEDIKVTPYSIDHSAYDAYMFLIETPDKVILHTGDFRFHGYRGYKTIPLIESYVKRFGKRKIDILITEGTMLSRNGEKYYKEKDLLKDATELMKNHKYVFLICSSTNLDSLASFYHAGQRQNKKMYGNSYVINQLEIFSKTAGKKTDWYNFKNIEPVMFGYETKLQNGEIITQEDRMKKYGFVTLINANEKYEKWIERFKNMEEKPIVIYSMWDGYLKKRNKAYNEKIAEFCKKYKAIPMHTSGHIYPKDLEKFINAVYPQEAIIPIHTENAKGLRNLKLSYGLKEKIKLNISEYIAKDVRNLKDEDSRKVSDEMLYELKHGRFSEFVKFVKQNPNKKLALCFRGNGRDSVIIYYNNHKVWELVKEDNNCYVKVSFDHARYTENWKDILKEFCEKYGFIGRDYRKIDIDNAIKKEETKRSYRYTVGSIISKNGNYNKEFVENTYDLIIPIIETYFDPSINKDWFKSTYERKDIKNVNKHGFIEKKSQQKIYLESNDGENGLYIYDLEFAQRSLPGIEKLKNQPDMHAIRFKNGKPESFVVIEVKSTKSAMRTGKSGFKNHLEGMEDYIFNHKDLVENRLKEAYDIISQYQKLGLRKIKDFDNNNNLELFTSMKNIEIRFILTGEAAKYYNANKNSNRVKREKKFATYVDEKGYEQKNVGSNRIEIYKIETLHHSN